MIEHTTIYDEYQLLEDRFKALEAKLWAAVDRAEKAEARHTALVEAVEKVLPRINPQYQTYAERCNWVDNMWKVEEELTKALAAAQEEA